MRWPLIVEVLSSLVKPPSWICHDCVELGSCVGSLSHRLGCLKSRDHGDPLLWHLLPAGTLLGGLHHTRYYFCSCREGMAFHDFEVYYYYHIIVEPPIPVGALGFQCFIPQHFPSPSPGRLQQNEILIGWSPEIKLHPRWFIVPLKYLCAGN